MFKKILSKILIFSNLFILSNFYNNIFANSSIINSVSEDEIGQLQPILEELDKRLIVYSQNFQEKYRDLRVIYEITNKETEETYQIGEYAVLDSPANKEESEVLTSLRSMIMKGKSFRDNYILLQLNTPDTPILHEEYILLGFNDDMSVRNAANIGEPKICLTTVNVTPKQIIQYSGQAIEDAKFHLFRKFENMRLSNKYINQSCIYISKDKLSFIRNKKDPIHNIQIITNQKDTWNLLPTIGAVKVPELEDVNLKSVKRKLANDANKRVNPEKK